MKKLKIVTASDRNGGMAAGSTADMLAAFENKLDEAESISITESKEIEEDIDLNDYESAWEENMREYDGALGDAIYNPTL